MFRTLFWHKWSQVRPAPERNVLFTVVNINQGTGVVRGYTDLDGVLTDYENRQWKHTVLKWKYF